MLELEPHLESHGGFYGRGSLQMAGLQLGKSYYNGWFISYIRENTIQMDDFYRGSPMT